MSKVVKAQYTSVLQLFIDGHPEVAACVVQKEELSKTYIDPILLYALMRGLPVYSLQMPIQARLTKLACQFALSSDILEHELRKSSQVVRPLLTEPLQILMAVEVAMASRKQFVFFLSDKLTIKYGKWLTQKLFGRSFVRKWAQLDLSEAVYSLEELVQFQVVE